MKMFENMKRAALLMFAVAAVLSCNKTTTEDPVDPEGWTTNGSPVGTWCLSSWNETEQAEVYMSFASDGTFELYQRVYSPYYEYYDGTWTQADGELSGTYSDGVEWGPYYVSYRDDEMRLVHSADEEDVSYFVKGDIPEEALLYGNPDSKSVDTLEAGYEFRNFGRAL